jgi:hypothetical protein
MKTTYYIIIAISLLTIWSCGDDDYSRTYIDNEVKTDLVGTLQLERTKAAPLSPIGFTFTLPQGFASEATVQVTANRQVNGAFPAYDETIATVTIPAGATSGSGSIAMPGDSGAAIAWGGISDYVEISLTGIALTQPEDGSLDDPFVLTSEAVSVTGLEYNSTYMSNPSLVEGALQILLDWENPDVNDIDMYVTSYADGEDYETAESGSRYEGDFFNASHPDGEYYVAVGFWSINEGQGDLPYSLTFTWPDGSTVLYESVFVDSENLSYEFPLINITKSTDSEGDATFTTSVPE